MADYSHFFFFFFFQIFSFFLRSIGTSNNCRFEFEITAEPHEHTETRGIVSEVEANSLYSKPISSVFSLG